MITKDYIKNIFDEKTYSNILWEYDSDLIQLIKVKDNEDKKTYNLKFNNLKDKYDVMIIDQGKDKVEGYCNCSLGKDGKKCEHLVWGMLKVNEEEKNLEKVQKSTTTDQYKLDILRNIANFREEASLLKVAVEFKDIKGNIGLNLTVGLDDFKRYKVKSISKLIDQVLNKEKLNYGKELNTINYSLLERDIHLINYLNYYRLIKQSNLQAIDFNDLSHVDFLEILKLLENTYVTYNDEEYFVTKSIKDIDIFIKQEEDLVLTIDNYSLYKNIFDDVVINDKTKTIYILEKKDIQKISLLKSLNILEDSSNYDIHFSNDHASEFLEEVLPKVFNDFNVNIDSALGIEVINEKLSIEFFCYMKKKNIFIKPKFMYGEYDIDESYKDKLIKRDAKEEHKVIDSLLAQGYELDIKTKEFYIKPKQSQFLFLTKHIFELKQKYKVNLDEDLKKAILNFDASSISISVNTNKSYDYFDIEFDMPEIDSLEIDNIIKGFEENRSFYKLENDTFLKLNDKRLYEQLVFLKEVIKDNTYKLNKYRVPKYKAIILQEEISSKFNKYNFNQGFLNYVESIKIIPEIDFDKLKDKPYKLRDYQQIGLSWLNNLYEANLAGLLADEMGLGKTIEVISFLDIKNIQNAIVVLPKALLYNWEKEFNKFAPHINTCIVTGSQEVRQKLIDENYKKTVLLTSYNSIVNDYKIYENKSFECIIIDEAQYIKNPKTKTARCVKMLKGEFFIALSGTPIENHLLELWSIFDFLLPNYLTDLTAFNKKYKVKETISNLEVLKKSLMPFILRRTKKEVLKELPDKIESIVYCEMEEEQKVIYHEYANKVKDEIQTYVKSGTYKNKSMELLSAITRLRQIAIDPSLFVDYKKQSGKIDAFLEIVNEVINNEEKVIVFSQYTTFLNKVKGILEEEDINYYYLDGNTRPRQRLMDVERFNKNKIPVYLISLKAGGVGLNLTSASNVIILDPWWNPAVENQAVDRTHRIGQKNKVQVFRLISSGTIEEKILLLKEDKEKLVSQILDNETQDLTKLSTEEIIGLLG